MRTRSTKQAGFTVIEALVAFTILSVSVAVLFQTFASGVSRSGQAETLRIAVLEAESMMDIVGVTAPLASGESAGSLANGHSWRVRVAPAQDLLRGGRYPLAVYDITVIVAWSARPADAVTLRTLKLGPR